MLKELQEYCPLNSMKPLEFKRKQSLDLLFINNIQLSQLSLQRTSRSNTKIKSLFTELLLLSTMLPLPILLLKERLTIEPSKFQSSMTLELKYLSSTTYLNTTMFLSISKCLLPKISLREMSKTSTLILKTTLKKLTKVKKINQKAVALTAEVPVVTDAKTDTL